MVLCIDFSLHLANSLHGPPRSCSLTANLYVTRHRVLPWIISSIVTAGLFKRVSPGKVLLRHLKMWWMLFPRWIWFFLGHVCVLRLHLRVQAMTVSKVVYSHAGMCPNEMNPNLWVDAMSTCMRECQSDQVRMGSVARAPRSLHGVFNCICRRT